MSDTELLNGLRHMADDHPCCEATILHAIDKLQQLERENAALRELAARMAAEMREIDHEFASLQDYDARKEAQP